MLLVLGVFLTVVVGSCLQRISGMGLGLVGGSVLMLFMGPVQGILVINVLALLNGLLITWRVRNHVEWKKWAIISSVMIFGSLPAALLISRMDSAPLMMLAGGALLVALALVTWGSKWMPPLKGLAPMLISGVLSGFTNTLAGVAGPVITVYARAARWEHVRFSATLQPIFVVGAAASIMTKVSTGAANLAHTPWMVWPAGAAGMIAGIYVGEVIGRRVAKSQAARLSIVVATAGATVAFVRGMIQL